MKRSKFTEDQIAFALKQVELGVSVEEVYRKLGISDATFYVWRKKYGSIGPSELPELIRRFACSQRNALRVVAMSASTYQYRPVKRDESVLKMRLKESPRRGCTTATAGCT